jgi:hypothetical protein
MRAAARDRGLPHVTGAAIPPKALRGLASDSPGGEVVNIPVLHVGKLPGIGACGSEHAVRDSVRRKRREISSPEEDGFDTGSVSLVAILREADRRFIRAAKFPRHQSP